MSLRNKKIPTLQAINHSLEKSLQKVKRLREYNSQQKRQNPLLTKIGHNAAVKKFQMRRIIHPQQEENETKIRFKSVRMHTEKVRLSRADLSGIANNHKQSLPYERSHTIELREHEGEEKYPFLTNFQKEQITRYEVFYIGPRRINSIRDFTCSSCEARISTGDSVAYRYEVVSALGHGSFGQVFKAFDHRKKEMVALKIIRNEQKFNRQAKVQIKILECVIMGDQKFRSNIVQLKHGFFFRGHACLVFELLHINLYECLKLYKFKGMNLNLIRKIAIQVLQGLMFLKKHHIIHCDLKPENILLKHENKTGIKLIDVGSGCFQGEQIYTYIQSRYYRAPEVILGIPYTTAIDIWSFGCILCELFLGYPIFPGENEPQQMLIIMETLGIPPSTFIQKGSRANKFFQGSFPRIKPNSKGKIRKPASKSLDLMLNECEDRDFVEFVKKILVWEPQNRMTVHDGLLDPWIMKGLPDEIKKQHIAFVKKQGFS